MIRVQNLPGFLVLRRSTGLRDVKLLVAGHLTLVSLPLSTEDKYGERRRPALLLPPLYVCSGHRKHPQSVQRLSRHHSEDASPPVRTLVRGLTMEPVVLNSLLLTLSLDTTPHRVEEYTIEMSVSSLCLL